MKGCALNTIGKAPSYTSWSFDFPHLLDVKPLQADKREAQPPLMSGRTEISYITWTHGLPHMDLIHASHLITEEACAEVSGSRRTNLECWTDGSLGIEKARDFV